MGLLPAVLAMATTLILLQMAPPQQALEIAFADPIPSEDSRDGGPMPTTRGRGEDGKRNQSDIIARNTELSLFAGMTVDDMMHVVCDGLQNVVRECSRYARFSVFRAQGGTGRPAFASTASSGRKRRFAFGSGWQGNFNSWPSSFGSNFGYGSNTNTGYGSNTNSGYGSNTNNNNNNNNHVNSHSSFNSGFGNNNPKVIICPTAQDQSMIFALSPDSTNYPAADIAAALIADPVLLACLTREIVLETDGPALVVEDFRLTANQTCPFTELRLWEYTSTAASGTCYVMQNFQENVLYKNCTSRFCSNCKNKKPTTVSTGYGNSHVDVGQNSPLNQKLCIAEYQRESVWAYCPGLAAGSRIIRDRIVIPICCTCQSIRCEEVAQHRKK